MHGSEFLCRVRWRCLLGAALLVLLAGVRGSHPTLVATNRDFDTATIHRIGHIRYGYTPEEMHILQTVRQTVLYLLGSSQEPNSIGTIRHEQPLEAEHTAVGTAQANDVDATFDKALNILAACAIDAGTDSGHEEADGIEQDTIRLLLRYQENSKLDLLLALLPFSHIMVMHKLLTRHVTSTAFLTKRTPEDAVLRIETLTFSTCLEGKEPEIAALNTINGSIDQALRKDMLEYFKTTVEYNTTDDYVLYLCVRREIEAYTTLRALFNDFMRSCIGYIKESDKAASTNTEANCSFIAVFIHLFMAQSLVCVEKTRKQYVRDILQCLLDCDYKHGLNALADNFFGYSVTEILRGLPSPLPTVDHTFFPELIQLLRRWGISEDEQNGVCTRYYFESGADTHLRVLRWCIQGSKNGLLIECMPDAFIARVLVEVLELVPSSQGDSTKFKQFREIIYEKMSLNKMDAVHEHVVRLHMKKK
ncbi:hypothetical protein PAPHI01_1935 [Pancytospora philotis]|nr:hypothetical protein PAPHI01_1935 [Pancytospora philotis]